MIIIENLSISYAGKPRVLDSLSLSLQLQWIHGIVGLNGAGKTTLLNALFGLVKPDSGTIRFQGEKLLKARVSFLVTENYFYPMITGREYLSLYKNPCFNADQWNKLFKLPLNDIIDTYSSGMKKKLAILGVIKQDKPIMILDEPFNGLDMESCSIIRSLLLELRKKGKTILVTSHILETLTNLCDQIHYLEAGKITLSVGKEQFDDFGKTLTETLEQKNLESLRHILGDADQAGTISAIQLDSEESMDDKLKN
jgi:ABC-2 type transport system ATP-binding protein